MGYLVGQVVGGPANNVPPSRPRRQGSCADEDSRGDVPQRDEPVPVALKIAYDGRRFDSFARQPQKRLRTVEGALLDALVEVGAVRNRNAAQLRAGSRTDKKVSARENVVTFRSKIPPERLPWALAERVPGLWALAAQEVADDFIPRLARWREYRYFIGERELPDGVDGKRLQEALKVFVGPHDFTAFAKLEADRRPQRVILEADVTGPSHGMYTLRVRGASFLWQQVRRMVAAVLVVCQNEATLDEVEGLLVQPVRQAPWGVAPPQRLVLWEVHDPRLDFTIPDTYKKRLQQLWVVDWGEALTAVRMMDGLFGSVGNGGFLGGSDEPPE